MNVLSREPGISARPNGLLVHVRGKTRWFGLRRYGRQVKAAARQQRDEWVGSKPIGSIPGGHRPLNTRDRRSVLDVVGVKPIWCYHDHVSDSAAVRTLAGRKIWGYYATWPGGCQGFTFKQYGDEALANATACRRAHVPV